jgi:glycosyltransferase involved in cell wall biosynthesis
MGAFILHLAEALAEQAPIQIVAPHAPGLADLENLGAVCVRRFHYAPVRWERLAYTGAMHDMVAHSLFNKFLFLFLNFTFFLQAISVARQCRAQLVHAHWWLPGGLVGALVSVITHTPLVVTTHGTDIEQLRSQRWAIPLARFVFSHARAVTCGSTYLREQLLELGVTDADRVSVIPMPVNPLFLNAESIRQVRDGESTIRVLTVARLSAQKNIDTLIAALALLTQRGYPAQLTIIGDGEQRAALEDQARSLGLQRQVKFLGARAQTELPRYYAAHDVFVLPSVREGTGLVLAEALFCGVPVVATRSGGVTDIVRDGETGLLVPERDPGALAQAIERLVQDRVLAARLMSNGQAWVRQRFAPDRVAAEFFEIYRGAKDPERTRLYSESRP